MSSTSAAVIPSSSAKAAGAETAGCVTAPPMDAAVFRGEHGAGERGAGETAGELGEEVSREVLPRDAAEHPEAERDRRVRVRTGQSAER
jgi:hypothetical protein